jgi:hypothetical protein
VLSRSLSTGRARRPGSNRGARIEKEGEMTIEKLYPSGAWRICGVVEGDSHYFLTRTYYGYTKRQAIRLWNREVREQASE